MLVVTMVVTRTNLILNYKYFPHYYPFYVLYVYLIKQITFKLVMPIPDFDHNHVIPPHVGDPSNRSDVSPFECTTFELCQKFSTSKERIEILQKFLDFRKRTVNSGIKVGFQWLDGSFLENIEESEGRNPNDLDVVTFYGGLTMNDQFMAKTFFPEFFSPKMAREKFSVDHYAIDFNFDPDVTIDQTRYWLQLFTHKRNGIWKGMLKIPLNTVKDDENALNYLKSL